LIRSDELSLLTHEGVAAVRGYGVHRIIDLRTAEETGRHPGPFAMDPHYRWLPMIDERADQDRDAGAETSTRATYLGSVRRNARHIAVALAAIADAPPGGVVVHCVAGKDRTGILVALALRVAGVAVPDIATDYARSDERAPWLAELAALPDDPARKQWRDRYGCLPENIAGVLEYLERTYGGVGRYLAAHGLTDRQLGALRGRLREPGVTEDRCRC
jgi:protein tyrosine/serine phosphatase